MLRDEIATAIASASGRPAPDLGDYRDADAAISVFKEWLGSEAADEAARHEISKFFGRTVPNHVESMHATLEAIIKELEHKE